MLIYIHLFLYYKGFPEYLLIISWVRHSLLFWILVVYDHDGRSLPLDHILSVLSLVHISTAHFLEQRPNILKYKQNNWFW
jgi:hypothetical protein